MNHDKISNDHVIIVERESKSVAVLFESAQEATEALDDSLLIDDLAQEDSLDVYVPGDDQKIDLSDYEVIISD